MSGFSWPERTNSGVVTVSICNLLIVATYDLDETFRECLSDIFFGIAITIQNISCMIHFKHNEIF